MTNFLDLTPRCYDKREENPIRIVLGVSSMGEKIVPLQIAYLDEMLDEIDRQLTAQDVPTVLRIRTGVLAEEAFLAAQNAQAGGEGVIRCVFPERLKVVLQYKEGSAPLEPDLSMLTMLNEHPCTYGVEASFSRGTCTLEVGKKRT